MRTMILACLMSLIPLSSSTAELKQSRPIRAQILVTGDDALTTGFAEQLKAVLKASPEFAYPVNGPYDIRIYVAGNFYWSDTDQGTNFNVVVVFVDSEDKYLGISNGACWEAEMKSCAQTVVSDASELAKRGQ